MNPPLPICQTQLSMIIWAISRISSHGTITNTSLVEWPSRSICTIHPLIPWLSWKRCGTVTHPFSGLRWRVVKMLGSLPFGIWSIAAWHFHRASGRPSSLLQDILSGGTGYLCQARAVGRYPSRAITHIVMAKGHRPESGRLIIHSKFSYTL